jgi:hypothetical protein
MNCYSSHGLQECLGFVVGLWFHQQRVLIELLLLHILIYWKNIYFIPCWGPLILILNKV